MKNYGKFSEQKVSELSFMIHAWLGIVRLPFFPFSCVEDVAMNTKKAH